MVKHNEKKLVFDGELMGTSECESGVVYSVYKTDENVHSAKYVFYADFSNLISDERFGRKYACTFKTVHDFCDYIRTLFCDDTKELSHVYYALLAIVGAPINDYAEVLR